MGGGGTGRAGPRQAPRLVPADSEASASRPGMDLLVGVRRRLRHAELCYGLRQGCVRQLQGFACDHMAKQVIIHAPFDIRLDDVPDADRPLGAYELRCQTELSALSPGTETRIYTGLEADRFAYRVSYPFTTGYNNISRITEVG